MEMDGFEPNNGVIVMAATNLEKGLDPALVRAGRFDRHVAVPLPDFRGRVDVLQHYLQVSAICVRVQHFGYDAFRWGQHPHMGREHALASWPTAMVP